MRTSVLHFCQAFGKVAPLRIERFCVMHRMQSSAAGYDWTLQQMRLSTGRLSCAAQKALTVRSLR